MPSRSREEGALIREALKAPKEPYTKREERCDIPFNCAFRKAERILHDNARTTRATGRHGIRSRRRWSEVNPFGKVRDAMLEKAPDLSAEQQEVLETCKSIVGLKMMRFTSKEIERKLLLPGGEVTRLQDEFPALYGLAESYWMEESQRQLNLRVMQLYELTGLGCLEAIAVSRKIVAGGGDFGGSEHENMKLAGIEPDKCTPSLRRQAAKDLMSFAEQFHRHMAADSGSASERRGDPPEGFGEKIEKALADAGVSKVRKIPEEN